MEKLNNMIQTMASRIPTMVIGGGHFSKEARVVKAWPRTCL